MPLRDLKNANSPMRFGAAKYGGVRKPGRAQRHDISEEQKEEIKEAFDLFDSEQNGKINYHELKVAMRALGFDVKKAEILELTRDYDRHETGYIGYEDFREILTERIANQDPLEEISKAFKLFVDDGAEKISFRNLKRIARELGEKLPDEELQAMIDEFDKDHDGQINEEEFVNIMKQTSLY
eukprot:GEMP01041456.1.p1 GENE.GEMP01041456.1~~GEMP01041456.1.p1  ORF type:complete len:182 (+),score=45.56 GEMP01041456.1:83-628(+)